MLKRTPLLLLLACPAAFGVRPFITDDARVVGLRQVQLESWVRGDRDHFQHWLLAAYGPIEPLELTVGTVHGAEYRGHPADYTIAGPLIQGKYLLKRPTVGSWPGVAVIAGALAPQGYGPFRLEGWDYFAFTAVTHSFKEGDDVLLHFNGGFVDSAASGRKGTWGVGSQIRVRGGFHLVNEVFSGDPYAETSGVAFQVGFRHFFSEYVQIDGTFGAGMTGQPRLPAWGTVGIRLVTPPLNRALLRKVRGRA